MKVRILGCGTAFGVPRIGGDWGACDPGEPRNRRSRSSILVEEGESRILVDTSPDLRAQLLAAGISDLGAVVWTHDHADHCHGIDDLRALAARRGGPLPGLASPVTLASLRARFAYCFEGAGGYPPIVQGREFDAVTKVGPLTLRTVEQPHGGLTSSGLRFEAGGRSLGYSTDCHALTDEMVALFAGVDLWIVDALRRREHPTHAHLDLALEWIARVAPKRAILTHMDTSMDYAGLAAELPAGVEPGYDGIEVEL